MPRKSEKNLDKTRRKHNKSSLNSDQAQETTDERIMMSSTLQKLRKRLESTRVSLFCSI